MNSNKDVKEQVKLKFASLMRRYLKREKHVIKVLSYKDENMKNYYAFRIFNVNDDYSKPPLLEINLPIKDPDSIDHIWKAAEMLVEVFYKKWNKPKLLD